MSGRGSKETLLAAVVALTLGAGTATAQRAFDLNPTLSLAGAPTLFVAEPDTTGKPSAADRLRGDWSLFRRDGASLRSASAQNVDEWGVDRNFALAAAEVIGINIVVWAFNEYLRGANFTQVNPRSWHENIKRGFSFDDNHFNTNQFAHPFHGSLYYSAARSNGFNYWASSPFAIAGSFMWECCGETHNMSINDWFATSLGGIAIGEATYRLAGTVLDNTATGSERTWREIGGLLINPMRGFNRLISGRWSQQSTNPSSRFPSVLSNTLMAGVRWIGEGESITDNTTSHGHFEVDFRFGSPFVGERKDPFDWMLFSLQVNTSEKQLIGRLQIRGNLFTSELKATDKVRHIFTVAQAYDYMNNNAYEFGGQSVTASLASRFQLSDNWMLYGAVDLYALLMGAVNSDYAELAQFPPDFNQERLREYDFGPGGGPGIILGLANKSTEVLALRYRLTYLYTLNGSVAEGDEAWHLIHWTWVRAKVPISRGFGLGADLSVFLRNSYYGCAGCVDTSQRNPEVKLYAFWKVGDRG